MVYGTRLQTSAARPHRWQNSLGTPRRLFPQPVRAKTQTKLQPVIANKPAEHAFGVSYYVPLRQQTLPHPHLRYLPRSATYRQDHINGDKLDYRACNLEWVTPDENRKRAKILRAMRAAGNDPRQLSPERLKNIFSRFSLMDGADQMHFECTHHMEF